VGMGHEVFDHLQLIVRNMSEVATPGGGRWQETRFAGFGYV
jgi:hypothetical protein